MPLSSLADLGARLSGFGRHAWGTALDVVLPPQCLACNVIVGEQGSICTPCWHDIDFLGRPHCQRCGYPFELDQGAAALCGACIRQPPVFDRARSVMVYGGVARALVLGFKHGDRTHAAPAFGRWLARAGAELLPDADVILPVPLHRWRLARRRFNQAAMMAAALAHTADKPLHPNLLRRSRPTATQGGLDRHQRARNVRRAFVVPPRHQECIAGQRILLVDDVLTTGATAGECAATLLRAGAAAVDVLTLTRVVRPITPI